MMRSGTTFDCIFVDKPKECSTCLESGKLQCLINKQYLLVKKSARPKLQILFMELLDDPRRYKAV